MLLTVAGTHSPEEPPLTSHPGCWTFQEGKPDGRRVQQRPPQARAQVPTRLRRSSKRLQHLPRPLSLGHSSSRGPVHVACGPHVRPWTCFLLSVLSGRLFGVALLFTSPSSPSSCPSCFLLLTSRCFLLSICLSPLTPALPAPLLWGLLASPQAAPCPWWGVLHFPNPFLSFFFIIFLLILSPRLWCLHASCDV